MSYTPLGTVVRKIEHTGAHNGGAVATDLFGCLRCGQVVFEQKAHDEWHDAIDRHQHQLLGHTHEYIGG